jgi:hypothetical protein
MRTRKTPSRLEKISQTPAHTDTPTAMENAERSALVEGQFETNVVLKVELDPYKEDSRVGAETQQATLHKEVRPRPQSYM